MKKGALSPSTNEAGDWKSGASLRLVKRPGARCSGRADAYKTLPSLVDLIFTTVNKCPRKKGIMLFELGTVNKDSQYWSS